VVQVVILCNYGIWHGAVYGMNGYPASGIQIGQQAGHTPYNLSSFQSGG
jgi:hypothetical protein